MSKVEPKNAPNASPCTHLQWDAKKAPLPKEADIALNAPIFPGLTFWVNEKQGGKCKLSSPGGALRIKKSANRDFLWAVLSVNLKVNLLKDRNFLSFRVAGTAKSRTVFDCIVRFHHKDGTFKNINLRSVVMSPGEGSICEVASVDFRKLIEDPLLMNPVLQLAFRNNENELLIDEICVV